MVLFGGEVDLAVIVRINIYFSCVVAKSLVPLQKLETTVFNMAVFKKYADLLPWFRWRIPVRINIASSSIFSLSGRV